jgi:hypothetical protein
MAAPNIGNIVEDVALENVPGKPAIIDQALQQLQQHRAEMQQKHAEVLNQLNEIHARSGYISSSDCACSPHLSLNCIPMQLYNATASYDCPLHYPPGIMAGSPNPPTKRELNNMSGRLRLQMLDRQG